MPRECCCGTETGLPLLVLPELLRAESTPSQRITSRSRVPQERGNPCPSSYSYLAHAPRSAPSLSPLPRNPSSSNPDTFGTSLGPTRTLSGPPGTSPGPARDLLGTRFFQPLRTPPPAPTSIPLDTCAHPSSRTARLMFLFYCGHARSAPTSRPSPSGPTPTRPSLHALRRSPRHDHNRLINNSL